MSKWINVKDKLPLAGKEVIAYYKNSYGNHRRIRAYYAPQFTINASSEDFGADEYCEEKDEYFLKEGWYESNEHEEINWYVDEEITHWMPLPEPPENK